ncbi:MAG TPA: DUF1735 domain-containing protein [Puia sp.]
MKNKCLYILAIILLAGACKKDDGLDSKDLLVYLPGDYASPTNTFTLPLLHTPLDVTGMMSAKIVAVATRPVAADVTLTITADTSLVDDYNSANKITAMAMPSGAYHIAGDGTVHIKAGATVSDSLEVDITDPASLTNPGGYLLPFQITKVEGKDKGIQVSSNRGAAFVNVTYQFNNIIASQTPVAGDLVDRTGWTVAVSNTTNGALGPSMLDGNNSTAWRSSNSSSAAKWAVIDMGAMHTLKGLQLTPDYVTTNENPTQMTVSISTDSLTWISQGVWTGTKPATGTNAANPDLKGVAFIAPVQARYFRLDITAVSSGSRAGIGEINAVE